MSLPPDPVTPRPHEAGWQEVHRELAAGDPDRVRRAVRALRRTIQVLALPVVATGVVAVVLAAWAFHDAPLAAVVAVVVSLPAIVLPVNVVRRTGAVAAIAEHPQEALAQGRDLLERARSLPGLDALAAELRSRGRGPDGRRMGIRRGVRLLRLVSHTVEAARPDPERHPLLLGLRPEQLRKVWVGATLSLWAWLVAGVVAVVALVVLVLRAAGAL